MCMSVWMWMAVAQVVLLSEDFEGGVLPVGWNIGNGGNASTWTVDATSGYFPVPPNSGNYAVFLHLSVTQDDTLRAPVLPNDTSLTDHRLVYDFAYWGESSPSGETLSVLVRGYTTGSGWGGWTPVRVVEISGMVIASDTVSLASISGSDSLQIAFRVWSDTNALHISLDNIRVLADSFQAADVAVRAFISPTQGQYIPSGNSIPVEVSVGNLSTQPQTFSVTVTIRDTATAAVVYQQTQSVNALPSGETTVVVLPDFSPTTRADFEAEAVVNLTGDQNPANDTLRVSFTSIPYLGTELARWALSDTTFARIAVTPDQLFAVRILSQSTAEVGRLDPTTQSFDPFFQLPPQGFLSGFAVEGPHLLFAWLDWASGQTTLELRDTVGNLLTQHTDPQSVVALEDAPGNRVFYAVVDPDLSLTEPNPVLTVNVGDTGLTWTEVGDTTLPANFWIGGSLYRYGSQTPWIAYADILAPSLLFVEHGGMRDSVSLGQSIDDIAITRVDVASVPPDSVFAAYILQSDTLRLISLGTYWGVGVEEKTAPPPSWKVVVQRGEVRIVGLPEGTRYRVLDLLGRKVSEGQVRQNTLRMTSLKRGIYFLRVEVPEDPGLSKIQRIMIP